jgi:subtilase family serine protease
VTVKRRLAKICAVSVAGATIAATTTALAMSAQAASTPSAATSLAVINNSVLPTTNPVIGSYASARMSVEVALAPRDQAGLNAALRAAYGGADANSTTRSWLAKGQFDARYAPTAATISAVRSYLRAQGLTVVASSSPFLVRATGSSAAVSAAFHTSLTTYHSRSANVDYYANSSAVRLPAGIAGEVLGVVGLTNTVREHTQLAVRHVTKSTATAGTSCEQPYPTRAIIQQTNNQPPAGFGGAPSCQGLTPSQTNSLYNAPHVGARGKGRGVTLALFELSAYQGSDIQTWARHYYGAGFTAPLQDTVVDGGPLNPQCPAGDTCPANFNGYSGDIEVDADIEQNLAVAPAADAIDVYNAPNDYTGQTSLDEYTKIANDDTADVVSSSWGVCEKDAGAGMAQAENVIFEQMALQGQSMFSSAGDSGAFDCIGSDGTSNPATDDPSSQPWVTSVGGTSFDTANPGTDPRPRYPHGYETVWNVDNLCNNGGSELGHPGIFWCTNAGVGAGGGGDSYFWGRPWYQQGRGITNSGTTYGNGTTNCTLAANGTPCREVPDVSADADEFTGYSEYCTGSAATPYSVCATITGLSSPGYFMIGGTSLSSPLWSAIIADRDSFQGFRTGNINPLVYWYYNVAAHRYFHDITGVGPHQAIANNNGLFPTTPGFDEATGVGTPNMSAWITGRWSQHR